MAEPQAVNLVAVLLTGPCQPAPGESGGAGDKDRPRRRAGDCGYSSSVTNSVATQPPLVSSSQS